MRKSTTAAITAAFLLLVAGCSSGPSEGDRVACETVIDAENTITRMSQEWLDDEDPDEGPILAFMRGMPDRVADARSAAESPELRTMLGQLHTVSDFDLHDDEEIGGAYYSLIADVERKCQDAGVDVERTA